MSLISENVGLLAVDRAAILSAIFERNHLRRQARLPLLDVRDEFERAVGMARHDAFEELLAPITAECGTRLRLKWIARWQRRRCTDRRPSGMGVSMMIGAHSRKVCMRILRLRAGIVAPDHEPRNLIVYGADK